MGKFEIEDLYKIERVSDGDPRYRVRIRYNRISFYVDIYTDLRLSWLPGLSKEYRLNIYDATTLQKPKRFYLDIDIDDNRMIRFKTEIKNNLINIIKGNGHI